VGVRRIRRRAKRTRDCGHEGLESCTCNVRNARPRQSAPLYDDVNHPRRRGACALSRSSVARRAMEVSAERSRQATDKSRPCGLCLSHFGASSPRLPPPPRRAGGRAQARAQAKPSTCEHGPSTRFGGGGRERRLAIASRARDRRATLDDAQRGGSKSGTQPAGLGRSWQRSLSLFQP
jgi:hypothetical protein